MQLIAFDRRGSLRGHVILAFLLDGFNIAICPRPERPLLANPLACNGQVRAPSRTAARKKKATLGVAKERSISQGWPRKSSPVSQLKLASDKQAGQQTDGGGNQ